MSPVREFLWAGLLAGLFLTGYGLLGKGLRDVPAFSQQARAAAVVNGRPISLDLYHRLLEGVHTDRQGEPLPKEDRRRILERMIEEELLVQEAIRIGMASRDRLARGYIVRAMLEFVAAEAGDEDQSDERLRAFYEENEARFTRPGKISLRTLSFDVYEESNEETIRQRALRARDLLLAGHDWERAAALSDPAIIPIPVSPLDGSNVLEYLGPTATRTAFELGEGEISEPVRTQSGYLLVRVERRWDDKVPPFESVRDDVAAAWRRERAENAVREYLETLRSSAEVDVNEAAVDGERDLTQTEAE